MKKNYFLAALAFIAALAGSADAANTTVNNNVNQDAQARLTALMGKPAYYVTNYGAKCDGVSLTDITTTNASAVISSASYSFTSADVGKLVSIYAGTAATLTSGATTGASNVITVADTTGITFKTLIVGANILPGAYVTKVLSGTQLVISRAATATASGQTFSAYPVVNTVINSASGGNATLAATLGASISGTARAVIGTNDATAIQNLINTINTAGTGGRIQLPAGICTINAGLRIYGNMGIRGLGKEATRLKLITNTQSSGTLYTQGGSNANLTPDISVVDLEIDNSSAKAAAYSANLKTMDVAYTNRLLVTNTYQHGTLATCVGLDFELNGITTNNVFADCGIMNDGTQPGGNGIGDGIGSVGVFSQSGVIANNTIRNVRRRAIMLEQQGGGTDLAAHYTITGNTIYMTQGNEIGISDSGGIGNLIVGNIIYGKDNTTGYGIAMDSGTLAAGLPPPGAKDLIADNIVYGTYACFLIDATQVAGGVGNLFSNNQCISPATNGYLVNTNASTILDGLTINGGVVHDAAAGAAVYLTGAGGIRELAIKNLTIRNSQNGIYIFTPVTRAALNNNTIYYNGASGGAMTSPFVIKTYAVTDAQAIGNYTYGGVTQTFNKVTGGTITGIAKENYGLNTFTVAGSSASGAAGTAMKGTFTAGTTGTNTVTVTFGSVPAAPNGWVCAQPVDFTTNANTSSWAQTAKSTTTATLVGTATTGDVISVNCEPY